MFGGIFSIFTLRYPLFRCSVAFVQIPAVAVTVRELAVAMSKKAREVVSMLRQMGESNVSPSFMVEPDIAQMVAKEFGLRTKLLKLRDR